MPIIKPKTKDKCIATCAYEKYGEVDQFSDSVSNHGWREQKHEECEVYDKSGGIRANKQSKYGSEDGKRYQESSYENGRLNSGPAKE